MEAYSGRSVRHDAFKAKISPVLKPNGAIGKCCTRCMHVPLDGNWDLMISNPIYWAPWTIVMLSGLAWILMLLALSDL